MKRRLKAEQKAKEKAEKEVVNNTTNGEAVTEKKKTSKISEEDVSPNEYFKLRTSAIQQMKQNDEDPYPHKFHVSIALSEFLEK